MTGAALCSRAAVLTTSPEAMPSPASGRASSETSASPVVIPTRSSSPSSTREVADRERSADCALGVVLVRRRRAEERHDRVADELLDGAAVALELRADALVVGAQDRLDVLRIHRLRPRREADEVAEDDRHDLALAARCAPRHG